MRNISGILAAALAMALVGGCATQAPKEQTGLSSMSASSAVLDVKPVKPAKPTYANLQYVTPPDESMAPPIVTPSYDSTPDATSPAKSHKPASDKKASDKLSLADSIDGKYKVKHGDTLYHIAKVKYGDGKKWTQIASANPGLSPDSLKVGQTIVVP